MKRTLAMTGTELAAVIVGVSSLVTAAGAVIRSLLTDSRKTRQERDASILGEWEKIADELRSEVVRVRDSCEGEIEQLRRQHERDRQEWLSERDRLHTRIQQLEDALYRTPSARTRKTDR